MTESRSSCHNAPMYVDRVYLETKYTEGPWAGQRGRQTIGTVSCCEKCDKPTAQVNRGPLWPDDMTETHWMWACQKNKTGPWYFVRDEKGRIVPEGQKWKETISQED